MSERVLVHQVHAGVGAVTELDHGLRRVVWDQPVKAIAAPVAEQLLRSESFHEAIDLPTAAGRYGVLEADVLAGAENGRYTCAVHRPAEGEPFAVLVLDRRTRNYLEAHARSRALVSDTAPKGATP